MGRRIGMGMRMIMRRRRRRRTTTTIVKVTSVPFCLEKDNVLKRRKFQLKIQIKLYKQTFSIYLYICIGYINRLIRLD